MNYSRTLRAVVRDLQLAAAEVRDQAKLADRMPGDSVEQRDAARLRDAALDRVDRLAAELRGLAS